MFVLDKQTFWGADTTTLTRFVECWEQFYKNSPKIDYFAELNIDGNLSEENISLLLRWKDPRLLTHPKATTEGRFPNELVVRVLNQRDELNRFRRAEITTEEFTKKTGEIFETGIVWRLFLFHIARPWEWPIADQHVFRAHKILFGVDKPKSIDEFTKKYKACFERLAQDFRCQSGIDDSDRKEVVRANKRLDNALMAYGQFLSVYNK